MSKLIKQFLGEVPVTSDIYSEDYIKSSGTLTNGMIWKGTKDEYDAIVTKDPNTIYYVEDDKPAPLPNTYVDTYELTETLTNKTFLGKKVYRKVVPIPSIVLSGAVQDINHGIINIESCVSASGYWKTGSTTNMIPRVHTTATSQFSIFYINETHISILSGVAASDCYIILEYTCTDR